MNLPPEPEQLGWRDAFWRICALVFVTSRLRREQRRMSELDALAEVRRDPD